MTVREICSVLTDAKMLSIGWNGLLTEMEPDNALFMEAFGDFKVKRVCHGFEKDTYEIHILATPVKEAQ